MTSTGQEHSGKGVEGLETVNEGNVKYILVISTIFLKLIVK